jgi:hypothetical protein
VTVLFDASATRSAVSSALREATAQVAPGGRLWFVAIGYAVVDPVDIALATDAVKAQVVSVLDVMPSASSEGVRAAPTPTPPAGEGQGTTAPVSPRWPEMSRSFA